MPSLKDLRVRINSVKQTRKITSAMKMVAAAKLRRAQEGVEAARPYAERMHRMLGSLAATMKGRDGAPPLLAGTGKEDVHLVLVATSDRGLCGAFNSNIVRAAREHIDQLLADGRTVRILCLGRKARDQLRRNHGERIVDTLEGLCRPRPSFAESSEIARRVIDMFEAGEFDVATIFYARFKSVIVQIPTRHQLIPFSLDEAEQEEAAGEETAGAKAVYEYEPDEEEILADLLPRNLAIQIFRAQLENFASEQGSRMTAMDNATRNAGEMIDKLTLSYNRTRQAHITKELIEIISGAEAL